MAPQIEPMPNGELLPAAVAARWRDNQRLWIGSGVLGLFAVALFGAIALRSQSPSPPATAIPRGAPDNLVTAPPTLAIEGPIPDDSYLFEPHPVIRPQPATPAYYPTLPGVPRAPRVPNPGYMPGPPMAPRPVVPLPVFQPPPANTAATPKEPAPVPGSLAGGRTFAGRLANPATTVPQGAVIQAVLETALDSTRPGFVRAVVSRDVRSFDGARVLIPRGSRLFGEYKADLANGQNRAFVIWQKLTRPDGVQIALDSPAADGLGRSGIKGKVNSHFFQRFSAAILQSSLDIGVGLATRSATNGTVVLGLPGSTTSITGTSPESVKPTLTTRQGSVVSVFVARDLDFASVS